jgi:hypothetical protein
VIARPAGDGRWPFQLELIAVAAGVILVVWLLWRQHWAELALGNVPA